MVLKVNERPLEHKLKAQALARDVARTSDNTALYASASKQISVSVPLRLLARIEVLASRAGDSRGSMAVTLMDIGLGVTFEEMSAELVAEVAQEISKRESELYSGFDPQEGA